jgi:hypothetical protein
MKPVSQIRLTAPPTPNVVFVDDHNLCAMKDCKIPRRLLTRTIKMDVNEIATTAHPITTVAISRFGSSKIYLKMAFSGYAIKGHFRAEMLHKVSMLNYFLALKFFILELS